MFQPEGVSTGRSVLDLSVDQARAIIVDDHPLFRRGLAVTLRAEPDLEVIGEVGSALEACHLARTLEIDIALIDVMMPVTSGLTLCTELREIQPQCKVLVLSVIDDPGLIADILRAGAAGYALKTDPVTEILIAIRQVLGSVRYVPPSIPPDALEAALGDRTPHPLLGLTRREREIFELVIRGRTSGEIAARLFISVRTAETHRQRIGKKLSAHSIAQMQRIAARHGDLPL